MSGRAAWVGVVVVLVGGLAASAGAWPTGREAVALKARPFALADVRLGDGPFKDAQQRTRRYLLELESDRLLHFFRVTAGLPAPGEPMGGWEKTELRGHTMGHYLSACAMMAASTGDRKLKAKAEGSEYEFDNDAHQYGVDTWRNVAYGYWQEARYVTMT